MRTTSAPRTSASRSTVRPARRLRLALGGLAVAATLVSGCSVGSSDPEAITTTTAVPTTTDATPAATTGTDAAEPVADEQPAAAADVLRPTGEVALFDQPGAVAPSRTLPAATAFGTPTALLVLDRQDGWAQVLVPGRPTGATAWVATDGIEVRTVTTEIRVDLTARTLTLLDAGAVVLTTPVAIGAPDAPTPTGRFAVTDKLETGSPDGSYGPFAVGLSARSEVLTDFAGGDGQIGIHGTNDPTSIGQPVSHGCIRVPNEVIEQLNQLLPLGTPVVVS